MKPINRSESGFTMIEVLVSLLILVLGLLGLVGLQARAQIAELESYQRAQALILVQDYVSRINTNRKAAGCYVTTTPLGTNYVGTPTCTSGSGTAATRAIANIDIAAWNDALLGVSEKTGGASGTSVGSIIGARGCVSYNSATGVYRVAVAWQGMATTISPASVDSTATCGQNLYGTSDALRREVGVTFRIASLT
jgi:type IV pilus assembly protein PilV